MARSNNDNVIVPNKDHWTLQWNNVGSPGSFGNLQLDIAGFLAILGEGSVLASAQVATLSKMMFLPRLLPAPQALLRPSRPDKMTPVSGFATGVDSGNIRNYVNYVGHILADAGSLPAYSVKCVEIRRKEGKHASEVKAKILGPTQLVAILGCLLSITLVAMAIWQQDGMAFMAVLCFSFLSTLVGVGNKWTLNLPTRQRKNDTWLPPGDVVVRYPKGNFLFVKCDDDVARELYFAPENINYLVDRAWKYRMISLVGTLLLMFGVIFLGNAGTWLQMAFAGSYMLLNAAYWIVAALPQRYHWDFSCFEVIPQRFDDEEELEDDVIKYVKLEKGTPKRADPMLRKRKPHVSYNKTFTQALFKVILATKSIGWVSKSQAAPITPAWNEWLQEALHIAQSTVADPMSQVPSAHRRKDHLVVHHMPKNWDPQEAMKDCIVRHQNDDPEKAEKAPVVHRPAAG